MNVWSPDTVPTQHHPCTPVVQLIVKPVWHFDDFVWIAVLHYDQVVWLEEWAPLLQEIQVPARLCKATAITAKPFERAEAAEAGVNCT